MAMARAAMAARAAAAKVAAAMRALRARTAAGVEGDLRVGPHLRPNTSPSPTPTNFKEIHHA